MNTELIQNLTSSGIYIFGWALCRVAVQSSISKWKFKAPEIRLRWSVQIRNLMFFGLILGLMLIWATALKTFALSIVVIASAIAISLKEYIMCFIGGFLKASSDYFVIGDRVSIGGLRGDVINHTPFTTTLFEVGPSKDHQQYTGKKITIPNSTFLLNPVINETYGSKYTFHTFIVCVKRDSQWKSLKKKIEQAADEICSEYTSLAQTYFSYLARKGDLEPPQVSPKVTLDFSHLNKVEMVIRIPAPVKQKEELEQNILALAFDFEQNPVITLNSEKK